MDRRFSLDIDPIEVLKLEVASMTQLLRGDTSNASVGAIGSSSTSTNGNNNGEGSVRDSKEGKQLFGLARPDSLDASLANEGSEYRQMLLRNVKKEVKQIMEEAVTRKLIHEESSSITSLCGAVEACLRYGLKRRALGLFREGSTTALLQKIVKECDSAARVLDRVVEEQPMGGGSAPLLGSSSVTSGAGSLSPSTRNAISEVKKNIESGRNNSRPRPSHQAKYLWIRIALLEKELAKIVEFLVENGQRFYEKESIIADACDGPLLASLLVGPCALDYTRMKTCDHLWTDPSADELVQRHRIHSNTAHYSPNSPRKPSLMIRRHTSSSSEESLRSAPPSAKEYVESLHQNTKSTLIYGKNNVLVHPREDTEALPGYLSLHHDNGGLTLKWTPNQLMNGCQAESGEIDENAPVDKSLYWDYALTIPIEEVVYVHCHQKPDGHGGMVVLVGQDGVQRPPLHFPAGGHLLAFLSCLENGLQPNGRLDPPLWSQRGKGPSTDPTGKVLPRLKRRSTNRKRPRPPVSEAERARSMEDPRVRHKKSSEEDGNGEMEEDEEEPTDYVFRIVFENETLQGGRFTVGDEAQGSTHFPWSSVGAMAAVQERYSNGTDTTLQNRTSIKQLCDTMRKQILSRAFYGWLAYCRHLRTVRTHLSGLVKSEILQMGPEGTQGLTQERWEALKKLSSPIAPMEIYRSIYFGGCDPKIRRELWPYLLGHYTWTMPPEERVALDVASRTHYEQTMSEWLAVEAIVRQQQKEAQEECQRAVLEKQRKLEAENGTGVSPDAPDGNRDSEIPLCRQPSFDNDVFEDRKGEFLWQLIAKLKRQWSSQTDLTTGEPSAEGDGEDEGFGGEALGSADRPSSSSTTDLSLPPPAAPTAPEVKRMHAVHPSVDSGNASEVTGSTTGAVGTNSGAEDKKVSALTVQDDDKDETSSRLSTSHESLMSPASPASHGGVYSKELLSEMSLNLHRIEKDVARCDRNYHFFNLANLDKLRNIMCTYVWEHLDVGYVQGMCDLLAPLLVILEDESLTHACFTQLMERMTLNFPHGGAMDIHFANMRSLIQILDPELFEHMHKNGDYTHFYFCYRWFLLDFKREFIYDDVFSVWETIWSALHTSSSHFGLFVALAMVKVYREIIIDNNMDFTDIIKFFNEMAERHDVKVILRLSRDLVHQLQELIENK